MDDARLIREARDWIADCFADVDVNSLSDAGGWAQFVADGGY